MNRISRSPKSRIQYTSISLGNGSLCLEILLCIGGVVGTKRKKKKLRLPLLLEFSSSK